MKNINRMLIAVLAAVLLLNATSHADAQLRARPTAVAVVDVQEVFNNLEEKERIKIDLQGLADGLKKEQEAMVKKLKQLQEDLKFIDPSQPGYEDRVTEVERQQLFVQAFTKYAEAKLEIENVRRIELIYNKMRKTIAAVAKADGYQIVLFKEVEDETGNVKFPGENMKQTNQSIEGRKVLWADESIDLTERVKTRMNNEFKARPQG